MTRVKICGVNSEAAFDAVVEAEADWLGFVFFERSPRWVTPDQAAALSARNVGGPLRVGLFVDPSDETIEQTLGTLKLDVLQLHAPSVRAAEIRQRFGLPVWRGLGISARSDLPATAEGADALLIEAKPPKDATRPGGNARGFDWRLLHGWETDIPWLLAGGLTAETVAAAVRITGARAVDLSSGVESSLGVKDPVLIHRFMKAARAA